MDRTKDYHGLSVVKLAGAGQEVSTRVIRYVGSDESIDRDGDTISVDGWDFAEYQKNPVVLFGHAWSSFPVARSINIQIDYSLRALVFDIEFPTVAQLSSTDTPSEHALTVDTIYMMAKHGLINAVSVGFQGIEWVDRPDGRDFKKQKLLELSLVPIPANPNALAIARGAGLDEAIIKGLCKSGRRLSRASRDFIAAVSEEIRGCHDRLRKAEDAIAAWAAMDDEEGESGKSAKSEKPYFTVIEN